MPGKIFQCGRNVCVLEKTTPFRGVALPPVKAAAAAQSCCCEASFVSFTFVGEAGKRKLIPAKA